MQLYFDNLSLGVNRVPIESYSLSNGTSQNILSNFPYPWNIYASPNFNAGVHGFLTYPGTFSSFTSPLPQDDINKIDVNITDLGTQLSSATGSIYQNPIPGNTLKGNFSHTLYFCDTVYYNSTFSEQIYSFNNPVQISLDFEAIREY